MSEKQIHDGSIKVRRDEEGFWCASVVFENEESIAIGRILYGVVVENEEIKKAFIDLMIKTFKHMVSSADPGSKVVFLDKEPNVKQ